MEPRGLHCTKVCFDLKKCPVKICWPFLRSRSDKIQKQILNHSDRLMHCPFTGPKMFCAGPNFFCQTKNLFTYCGSHKILCQTIRRFAFSKIGFCAGTKVFEIFGLAQKIWTGTKHFGTCKRTRHKKNAYIKDAFWLKKTCF